MMSVKRYFLEIIFKNYKQQNFLITKELEISLDTNKDYELNKFFYRNILNFRCKKKQRKNYWEK